MLEKYREHILYCLQQKLMYDTIHVFLYFIFREQAYMHTKSVTF